MSDRDIRRYCAVWGRPLPIWKQSGGDRYKVLFNDHPIIVKEDIDGSFIMIYGGEKAGGRPCFILDINPVTKNSTFISLEAGRWGDTCFTDNYQDSTALVKVAIHLLKTHGARRLELTDNSTILCPDASVRVSLSELSFITTGQTWYERQIPGLQPEETHIVERLDVWRRAVHQKTWAEVAPWIPEAADQGLPEELAKDVLTRMKKSGNWCVFFMNNMDNCRKAFGIDRRLHWTHWSGNVNW